MTPDCNVGGPSVAMSNMAFALRCLSGRFFIMCLLFSQPMVVCWLRIQLMGPPTLFTVSSWVASPVCIFICVCARVGSAWLYPQIVKTGIKKPSMSLAHSGEFRYATDVPSVFHCCWVTRIERWALAAVVDWRQRSSLKWLVHVGP